MSKLLPGENLVLKSHPHWITIVGNLVIPAVLVIAVLVADFTLLNPDNFYVPKLRTFLTLGVVALGILWVAIVWIAWQSITYTLTDQRIKIERGILSRQEKLIAIDRVQDVSTQKSLIGRMLGYGHVQIESAGEVGSEVFRDVPSPDRLRDEIFVQSEKRRGGVGPTAPTPPAVAANQSGV